MKSRLGWFAKSMNLAIRPIGYRVESAIVGDASKLRNKSQISRRLANSGFDPELIVDVGVARGTPDIYAVWPSAHYELIEPLAKFEPDLIRITSKFDSARYRIALAGSRPSVLQIAIHPKEPYTHMLADEAPANWERSTVPVISIDQILSEVRTIRTVRQCLLKIDVDGGEIDVLNGAVHTLLLDCVLIIEAALLDEEQSRFGQIIQFMLAAGYECFDIIEPLFRPRDGALWQVDLVFVRRESSYRRGRGFG